MIKALQKNPRLIYESLESHLQEDFGMQPAQPGHPLTSGDFAGMAFSKEPDRQLSQ